jgi:acetolactate synthase-1/2/3 large subunit
MIREKAADIIVRLLERQGISVVAGIPGGMNLPLYDALSKSTIIHHVLARHEQGAGFMAQGMARATGKPAVCLATSGPGATNVLTAIADAKLDSIPVICITGQVPVSMIGSDAFQEVDTYGMSIPVTKHNFLVRDAKELLHVIPEAFRIATSGRPGPVLIDVPKDVQNQVIEFEFWPEPGIAVPVVSADDNEISEAARYLNEAERPILYLGGGVVHAEASDLVRALAEKADIPCVMSLMGLGVMSSDHPLSLGLLGMHGARYANLALEECDLIVAMGSRFGDRTTGKVSSFGRQAKVIHFDIDASEINKIVHSDIRVLGDLKTALEAMVPRIKARSRSAWTSQIQELKSKHPLYPQSGIMDPSGLIRMIGSMLPKDAIITTDVGQHQMWTAQSFPHRHPRCWMTSAGLGTMGFGLPSAIGAALECPDRTVVCFSGDGSMLMNIQELATAVEEDVNVKIILFDNQALGLVYQQQDLFYEHRFFASKFKHHVDFVRVAQGFGIDAVSLAETSDPERVLREMLNARGPCLIHVPIDLNEMVFPMVPPGAANKDMMGGEGRVDPKA